jgi:transcriptional regulator with XRE-family HTH domain
MPDEKRSEFSIWLEAALKKQKMSTAQFAKLCGVSAEGAGYWVNGGRHPKREQIEKIAAALDKHPSIVATWWVGIKPPEEPIIEEGEVYRLRGPGGVKLRADEKVLEQLELEAKFAQRNGETE